MESYLLHNKILMKPQEKAKEIYTRSLRLHGISGAKEQAIKTVEAIQYLVPFDGQKFWNEVTTEIEKI